MVEDKLVMVTTTQTLEIFNNLNSSLSTDNSDIDLKTDLFSIFNLQNPVLKDLEEIPADLWLNYFIIQGLLDHYSFKNLQAFTKEHSADSYWFAAKISNGIKILKENKKTGKIFSVSKTYLNNANDKDYDDLINDKNILAIKKQIRLLIGKILLPLNGFYKKIEPLLELTRGHDIAPLSLYQYEDSKLLQLAENIINPKYKEIIKIFNRSNIKDIHDKTTNIKKDEPQSENPSHSIFYINDTTEEQKDLYRHWLVKEAKEHTKIKNSKSQLTAYVKAGNLVSKSDEIESLSFSLNIMEIARMGKRNFNVIITKDILGDKTFIFKNNDEVEIFDNNQSYKYPMLDGIVSFVIELLSAPTPPKPKFSLGLKFSSEKKSKVFKKPPTDFIKFT